MDWNSTLNRLRADKGAWEAIARHTGLSGNQIRRIVHGDTTRPGIDTVEKIIGYYEAQDNAPQQASA